MPSPQIQLINYWMLADPEEGAEFGVTDFPQLTAISGRGSALNSQQQGREVKNALVPKG